MKRYVLAIGTVDQNTLMTIMRSLPAETKTCIHLVPNSTLSWRCYGSRRQAVVAEGDETLVDWNLGSRLHEAVCVSDWNCGSEHPHDHYEVPARGDEDVHTVIMI
jgi:hypothetical protein